MMRFRPRVAVLLALLPLALVVACSEEAPQVEEAPQADAGPEYLQQDIPPCTPVENSDREPCGPAIPTVETSTASLTTRDDPVTIRWMLGEFHAYLDNGVMLPARTSPYVGHFSGHMVVRATYLPGTVRCESNRAYRVLYENGLAPELVWATDTLHNVQCFVDVRVNSYILGNGPPRMTVLAAEVRYQQPSVPTAEQDAVAARHEQELEGQGVNEIAGREAVLFIGPAFDYGVKVWEVHWTWGVNKLDDGTVMILHPRWSQWLGAKHRSQVEMTLADFTAAVQTAHATRTANLGGRAGTAPAAPMVVLDANKLDQHHIDTGNTTHPDGPPEPPPPVREK